MKDDSSNSGLIRENLAMLAHGVWMGQLARPEDFVYDDATLAAREYFCKTVFNKETL